MIQEIKTAIAAAIHGELGDGYTIYTETVEQGLTKPCFLITCIKSQVRKVSIGRYGQQMDFDIQYHSNSQNTLEDSHDVATKLYGALECIQCAEGIKLRGRNQSHGMVEDTLHHVVSYKVMLKDEEDEVDKMESIDTTIVKES